MLGQTNLHSGCTWCVVEQGQLAERALVGVGVLDDAVFDRLKGSMLHHVAVVALVALSVMGLHSMLLQRVRTVHT